MKKVLFVMINQFGYHPGTYYYAKYLTQAGYEVGIICTDMGMPCYPAVEGCTLYMLPRKNVIMSRLQILKHLFLLRKEYDYFVFRYFAWNVYFLSLLFIKRNKIFLDIRSEYIGKNRIKSFLFNTLWRIDCFWYKRIFILSKELAYKYHISPKKYIYLPLGADDLSSGEGKDYASSLNLLYIGILDNRNIEQCIEGLNKFYKEYKKRVNCSFDIICKGSISNVELLKNRIAESQLQNIVKIHGQLNHEQAKPFFDKCNVGISWIPMTEYFDFQPATKTYEYIVSGLICIGTATTANKSVIDNENGILCEDNPDSFYKALKNWYARRNRYDTATVKLSMNDFKWFNIVNNILVKTFI